MIDTILYISFIFWTMSGLLSAVLGATFNHHIIQAVSYYVFNSSTIAVCLIVVFAVIMRVLG